MVDILSFRGYSVASKYFENQNIWKSKYLVFKTTCVMRIVSQKKEGVKSKLYMQEFFAELL